MWKEQAMATPSTQQSAIALDRQVQVRNLPTGQAKAYHGNRFPAAMGQSLV
jgi:hypothetical protein